MFSTPPRASESPDTSGRVALTSKTGRSRRVPLHCWPVPRALELAVSNSSRVTHTLSGTSDLLYDANVCSQKNIVSDSTYSFPYDDLIEYERSRELTHTMSNSRRCLEFNLSSQYLTFTKCIPRISVYTEKNTHETQVNLKKNADDKTTKTESILNNTDISRVATNRQCAEKMSYCRAVLSSKWDYQKKVAEKNNRLQLIVSKLVKARQREKQKDAWENFIKVLKNKHGVYENDSLLMPNLIKKDEHVQPEVIENYHSKMLATRSTNVCRNLLKDIYEPHSSSTVDNTNNIFASRHKFGNTTWSTPSYSPALYENEPVCYPTSSQCLRMRYRDNESQSPCFKSGCAPHSRYRENRVIVDRDFVYGRCFNTCRQKKHKRISNRRNSFAQTEDYWAYNDGNKLKEITHYSENMQDEEAQTNSYTNRNTLTSPELSKNKKYDASLKNKNESDSDQNERNKIITNKNNKNGGVSTEVPLNVIDSNNVQSRRIEKKYYVLEGNNNDDSKESSQVLESNEKTLTRVTSNINSLHDNGRERKISDSLHILKSYKNSRTRKGLNVKKVKNSGKNKNISSQKFTSHRISQTKKGHNRNSEKVSGMKEKETIESVENSLRKEKRNKSLQELDNHRTSQTRKGPNRNDEEESGIKEEESRNNMENSRKVEKIFFSSREIDSDKIKQIRKRPNRNSKEKSVVKEIESKNVVENSIKQQKKHISSQVLGNHRISETIKGPNRTSEEDSRIKKKGRRNSVENSGKVENRNISSTEIHSSKIRETKRSSNRNREEEGGIQEKETRNIIDNNVTEEKRNISSQELDSHRSSQTKKSPNNNSEEESETKKKGKGAQIYMKQENNVKEMFIKESTEITELTDKINSKTILNRESLVLDNDTIPEFYENKNYDSRIRASNESFKDRLRTNKDNHDVGVSTEVLSNISISVQSGTIKKNNRSIEENNIKDRLKRVSQVLESHKKSLTKITSNISMCLCVQDNMRQGKISDSSLILDSYRISQARKDPNRNSKEESSMKEKGNYLQIDTKQEEDFREKFKKILIEISKLKDKINSKTTLNRDSLVIIHNKLDVLIKMVNSLVTEIKHKLPDSDNGVASKYKEAKSSSDRNCVANTGTSVDYGTKKIGVNSMPVTHTDGTSAGSCCSLIDTLIISKCMDRYNRISATCRKKTGADNEMNNDVPHDCPLSCEKNGNADTDSKRDNTHDQFVCTMRSDQPTNTLFSGTNPNKLGSTGCCVSKINTILIEELVKSNQAKKDIENILNGETYRPCGVKITFDIPTKENSTEVTASLSKTKLSGEITCTTMKEIRTPIDDYIRNESRMATQAVNTDPLSLQALLMVSGQTVRNLMSFMCFDFPLMSLFNIQSLQLRRPLEWTRTGVSPLTCNLSGATFPRPKQLSEHIRRHNIGDVRNCCVGCCLVDLRERASRGFICQYCGQCYSRSYCCELHQQSCARRLGRRHDVTESLSLLS